MTPLGGSERQKRQYSGRSRSSSDMAEKARVTIQRGSIHSFSRLTVSPLPAPSAPENTTMTGNLTARSSSCCTPSSSARNSGSCFL